MEILIIFFPVVILFGVIVGTIAIYLNDRNHRNDESRSIVLYATGILIMGVVAIFIFIYAVAPVFHFLFLSEQSNWIDGLIGVPAFFALGAATFIYFWLRHGKHPTLRSNGTPQKRAAP